MHTDITEREQAILNYVNQSGGCHSAWTVDVGASYLSTVQSMADRGLLDVELSERMGCYFVWITSDGALLARLYGEP